MDAVSFTIVAILTLALGIGANTAVFTLVHRVLLDALPVTEPEQLVELAASTRMSPTRWDATCHIPGFECSATTARCSRASLPSRRSPISMPYTTAARNLQRLC